MYNVNPYIAFILLFIFNKKIYMYWNKCYIIIIIIVVIKKGRQRKAEREWCIPYQSEDHSPTIPTLAYRQKEEKGKESSTLLKCI